MGGASAAIAARWRQDICTLNNTILTGQDPHQWREGIAIACHAIRSHTAYIYLRYEYGRCYRVLDKAIRECYDAGLLGKKILGTDLSYEDLALKFMYWSRAAVEGEDRMKTIDVWRIRAKAPPGGRSAYHEVVLWVGKKNGALVRAEGFDAAGKLVKRFEVVSAQVVNGLWVLQRLRIEAFDPATGKLVSRTSMTIDAPAPS